MSLENLKPAAGSTHKKKRVGRGAGSGMGKTASRGANGQKSRTGYKIKRGFEGGQQPIQKRLPKVGFTSRVLKPQAINVDKISAVASLEEITIESLKTIVKIKNDTKKVKLIGSSAKDLQSKIKDENISFTGANKETKEKAAKK